MVSILGISAFYHDSAACLVVDGKIVASRAKRILCTGRSSRLSESREPIVCTPADSYRCFMRTGMDYLVLETFVLSKVDRIDRISKIDM